MAVTPCGSAFHKLTLHTSYNIGSHWTLSLFCALYKWMAANRLSRAWIKECIQGLYWELNQLMQYRVLFCSTSCMFQIAAHLHGAHSITVRWHVTLTTLSPFAWNWFTVSSGQTKGRHSSQMARMRMKFTDTRFIDLCFDRSLSYDDQWNLHIHRQYTFEHEVLGINNARLINVMSCLWDFYSHLTSHY